jgi:putative transposase
MIAAAVGAANCTDRDGLDALCGLNANRLKLLKKIYADLGYSGEDMRERIMQYGIELECIGRKNKKKFEVEPKRWIVERTFAWLGKFRRLSKDYELITNTSLNMIYLGMIRIMSKRLSNLN